MSQISSIIIGTVPGGGPVLALQGNTGPAVPPTGAGVINVVGAGNITVAGAGNTLTITDNGGGFTWNKVAVNTALVEENGYITNNVAGLTFTLPAVAAIGDTFIVTQLLGTWDIVCGAGQDIIFGTNETTVGGFLQSFNIGDTVKFVCVTANSTFIVLSSMGGQIQVG